MHCPNCGLANPDNAKFCANCGTAFGGPSQFPSNQSQPQYQAPIPTGSGNRVAKNIGIGCLIAIAIVLLFGLSCTRACFGFRHRHSYLHQLRRRASNNDPNAYAPMIFTSTRLRRRASVTAK